MHLSLVMTIEQLLKKDFCLCFKNKHYTTGKAILFLSLDLAHFDSFR